ncbi:MAG: hypothetical protein QME96_07945, partial [Myxococcota bacterium]|nr:hypothetical protein [Myxococcota bacterium]
MTGRTGKRRGAGQAAAGRGLLVAALLGCGGGTALVGNGRDVPADEADALDVEAAGDDGAAGDADAPPTD